MNHAHSPDSTRPRARWALALTVALVLASLGIHTAPSSAAVVKDGPITFTITRPDQGVHYTQGQQVYAQYSCTSPSDSSFQIEYCNGPVPSGATIDTSTEGKHTFTVTARYARFIYQGSVDYFVDAVPGSISIISPTEGTTYDRTKPPLVTFSCTPGTSAVKSCVGTDTWDQLGKPVTTTVTSGQRIKAQVGKHQFKVVATDAKGNVTSATRSYKIGVGHVPDAIIAGKGDNLYNSIAPQTLPVARKTARQTVKLTVQNDGIFLERFRVRGAGTQLVRIKLPGAPAFTVPGWQVAYYERGACATCLGRDITKWVVAGTYLTPLLSHNGSQTIFMTVIPTPFAAAVNRDVTITSPADPNGRDVVRAALR